MKLFVTRRQARAAVCAGMLAASALLASCGGGEQVAAFHASRVIGVCATSAWAPSKAGAWPAVAAVVPGVQITGIQ